TTTRKKRNRVYQQSWYYCPVSKTKGEVICGHAQRYRKDVIELRLMERAMEAMKRKPVAATVAAVNEALKRSAARANGREDELRADLAKAEAERERMVEAIASGGGSVGARGRRPGGQGREGGGG